MYNEKVMKLFTSPMNAGIMKNASATSTVTDSISGDVYKFFVKVENNKIVEAKFKTFGGVISIAACSVATDFILNKQIDELDNFNGKIILDELGKIPESYYYTTTTIEEGIRKLLVDYKKKSKKNK